MLFITFFIGLILGFIYPKGFLASKLEVYLTDEQKAQLRKESNKEKCTCFVNGYAGNYCKVHDRKKLDK